MDKYRELSDYGKGLAAANILQRRGDGFANGEALRTAFSEEVQWLTDNPQLIILHEANSVANATALRLVLEEHALILELDLGQYNVLGSSSKTLVVQAVFARRGAGYANIQILAAILAEEMANFLSQIDQVLMLVNLAESPQDLEGLFAQHGKGMGLEMDAYNLLIRSRQLALLEGIFAGIPYASLDELAETFNEAVGAMLTSYSVITFSHYDMTLKNMVMTL